MQSYVLKKASISLSLTSSDLNFVNSVGLNFLLIHDEKFRKDSGGELALANANDQIIGLLEITKLKTTV